MATAIGSFGFRHGGPPIGPTLLIIDVRRTFRNPWNPYKTLTPQDVGQCLEGASDFPAQYQKLKNTVILHDGPVSLGCVGGQHRSVYLADRLGRELGIPVYHRDRET